MMAKLVNLQQNSTMFKDISLNFRFENFPDHFPSPPVCNPQVIAPSGSAQMLLIINLRRVWSVAGWHKCSPVPISEKV